MTKRVGQLVTKPDPDWRNTIGAAARDRARAFSVAAMVDNHERVYADPSLARSPSAATRAS